MFTNSSYRWLLCALPQGCLGHASASDHFLDRCLLRVMAALFCRLYEDVGGWRRLRADTKGGDPGRWGGCGGNAGVWHCSPEGEGRAGGHNTQRSQLMDWLQPFTESEISNSPAKSPHKLPRIFLKCSFWLSRSGVRAQILNFERALEGCSTCWLVTTLGVQRLFLFFPPEAVSEEETQLSKMMMKFWANFARNGWAKMEQDWEGAGRICWKGAASKHLTVNHRALGPLTW